MELILHCPPFVFMVRCFIKIKGSFSFRVDVEVSKYLSAWNKQNHAVPLDRVCSGHAGG
jgi:hypothetical protein